jgi:hypothetical protein
MSRIVLTGGPGAGKTVISITLAQGYPERFVRVPEAATQMYAQLGVRWGELDAEGRRDLQRRIYHLQIQQEASFAREHPGKTLLLDRGTVDGAAYWPDGRDSYWPAMGTTYEAELARYDLVIWMQTSAALGAYDGDMSNPVRQENPAAAIALGEKLLQLWSAHSRFERLGAYPTIEQKIAVVRAIVQ